MTAQKAGLGFALTSLEGQLPVAPEQAFGIRVQLLEKIGRPWQAILELCWLHRTYEPWLPFRLHFGQSLHRAFGPSRKRKSLERSGAWAEIVCGNLRNHCEFAWVSPTTSRTPR